MNARVELPKRGIVAVRADGGNTEVKKILADLQKAWHDFKAENDKHLDDIRKNQADIVRAEKVDRLNNQITELQGQLSDLATKHASLELGPGIGGHADAESARAFALQLDQESMSVEEYRAYKSALNSYMRRGDSARDIQAAMSVGSDPNGGYTVTPDMSGRIVTKLFETSPMRQLASVVTIGTDRLQGFNDLEEASAGWVGETGTRDDTNTPQLGKWEIPVHEMYAQPKATQQLLDDSQFNIEQWLANKVSDKFTRVENAAFVTGDGIGKPRGLLTYTTVVTADSSRAWGQFQHVNTGQSGAFASSNPGDQLVDLVFAVKAAYRTGASFLMNRATLAAVRKLKDGDGNYLWAPDFTQRQGGLLLGYPVAEGEDMPDIAANSLSIAFGNFAESYTIVDRVGIRVLRDPYTSKPYVRFYTTKRVGGGAINFEAVKFLRFGTA